MKFQVENQIAPRTHFYLKSVGIFVLITAMREILFSYLFIFVWDVVGEGEGEGEGQIDSYLFISFIYLLI